MNNKMRNSKVDPDFDLIKNAFILQKINLYYTHLSYGDLGNMFGFKKFYISTGDTMLFMQNNKPIKFRLDFVASYLYKSVAIVSKEKSLVIPRYLYNFKNIRHTHKKKYYFVANLSHIDRTNAAKIIQKAWRFYRMMKLLVL